MKNKKVIGNPAADMLIKIPYSSHITQTTRPSKTLKLFFHTPGRVYGPFNGAHYVRIKVWPSYIRLL